MAAWNHRVENWDDERADGNSLIVTLRRGWKFSTDPAIPTHVEGFDKVRDAKKAVREALPCRCRECTKTIN